MTDNPIHRCSTVMRVRMNGQKKLEEFNAGKYSLKWLQEGHARTDGTVPKVQRTTLLDAQMTQMLIMKQRGNT